MIEGPYCCGPRMSFVPGYAVDRFMCRNCGCLAVRTKLGFRKGSIPGELPSKSATRILNVDQFRERADAILDQEK